MDDEEYDGWNEVEEDLDEDVPVCECHCGCGIRVAFYCERCGWCAETCIGDPY